MRRMLTGGIVLLLSVIGGSVLFPGDAYALACIDFPSQASAQDYLRQHPAEAATLDADDHDGIACESLSAPRDENPVSAAGVAVTTAPAGVAVAGTPDATLDPATALAAPVSVPTAGGAVAAPPAPLAHTGSSSTTMAYLGALTLLAGWLIVLRTRPLAVRPAFDLLPRRRFR